MNTKHTPGPWTVSPDGSGDIEAADGCPVASVQGWLHRGNPECCANARLIARAPDLLAALDAIHATMDGTEWDSDTLDTIADVLQLAGYEVRDADCTGGEA